MGIIPINSSASGVWVTRASAYAFLLFLARGLPLIRNLRFAVIYVKDSVKHVLRRYPREIPGFSMK
jgi:hypothetical protein